MHSTWRMTRGWRTNRPMSLTKRQPGKNLFILTPHTNLPVTSTEFFIPPVLDASKAARCVRWLQSVYWKKIIISIWKRMGLWRNGLSRTTMRFPCLPEHEHDKKRKLSYGIDAHAWFSRSWKCRVLAPIVEGMPMELEGIVWFCVDGRAHGESAGNAEASCDHTNTRTKHKAHAWHAVGGKSQTVWLTMTI